MIINIRKNNQILIIELIGKVDAQQENVENELLQAIQGEHKIIINCQKLTYINSIGLRAFLKVLKQVINQNGKLTVCSLSPNIKDFFLITGFLQLFEVYDTEEQAMKAFNDVL